MTEIRQIEDRAKHMAKAALPELHELEERTIELVDFIHQLLIAKKLTISFCESCTGGYANAQLVMHDHCSAYITFSQTTYSLKTKVEHLGLDEDELKRVGEYSCPGAKLMAQGQLQQANSDIAVSITGFAGSKADPGNLHTVGVVWIGLATREHSYAEEMDISSRGYQRRDNIRAFTYLAHRQVLRYLLTLDEPQCAAQTNAS